MRTKRFELILKGHFRERHDNRFPKGFQRVGHVAIVNIDPAIGGCEQEIAGLILENYPHIKTVCRKGRIEGEFRKPGLERIAGNGTETVHKENHCSYALDVAKVMFAKGNSAERTRLASIVGSSETVVDLFAGIGYFSVPIAKSSKARLIAIEKNPESMKYLKQNIANNNVRMLAILGDARHPPLKVKADRVLMGFLPETSMFLRPAFSILKGSGIIHYHDTYSKKELWDKPLRVLNEQAEQSGFRLNRVISKRVVKPYAPKVYHIVIDAEFVKA